LFLIILTNQKYQKSLMNGLIGNYHINLITPGKLYASYLMHQLRCTPVTPI